MALIVIPARFQSSRFPGKPLVSLTGSTGERRTLVERSWLAANSVRGNNKVVIATDDDRIAKAAKDFGAEVVMTSDKCRNGTERCAEVIEVLDVVEGVVVNFQGDAPLTPPWFVEALIDAMETYQHIQISTPVLRCDPQALNGFLEDRANNRVGATTAVFDQTGRALYFSKEVLPFTGRRFSQEEICPVFHHVGVYAYRTAPLRQYRKWDEGKLERWEGLEQLRFMEFGVPVQCVEVDAIGRKFWELNNPTDVERIEKIMKEQGIA